MSKGKSTELIRRREILIGLAAGTMLPFIAGCAENAALGRSQLMLVSDAQLAQLSAQAWAESLQRERVSRDPAYTRRLERVGRRIVNVAGLPNLDWEFVVFDSDTVNAWVLPNGKVGFYKGILDLMQSDDHIATVMGHEIAHVAGRHSAERASQEMATQIGLSLVTSALNSNADIAYSDQLGAALGMGVSLGIILPYSRQHEFEADRIGIDYMVAAGYDPRQAIDFWIAMSTTHSGGQLEFASTHPSDEHRIEAMRAHMAARGYV